jgi:hypothetical protein
MGVATSGKHQHQQGIRMTRNQRLREKLLAEDPRCRYCGVELHQRRATLDHVFPRRRGGSDAISYLRKSFRFRNMAKAARLPQEILEWATRIVAAAGGIWTTFSPDCGSAGISMRMNNEDLPGMSSKHRKKFQALPVLRLSV